MRTSFAKVPFHTQAWFTTLPSIHTGSILKYQSERIYWPANWTSFEKKKRCWLPLAPHICVGELRQHIGSGNGLAPNRRQAITWTNADLLSIGPLGTSVNNIWTENLTFSFKTMRLKMSSAKLWPFWAHCPGIASDYLCMEESYSQGSPIKTAARSQRKYIRNPPRFFNSSCPDHADTETEMSSFWWNFHHWLHWKLSFWQLQVQPLMKILPKWWHFRFSGWRHVASLIVVIIVWNDGLLSFGPKPLPQPMLALERI